MSALEDRRARLRVGKAAAYRRRRLVVFGLLVTLVLAIASVGLYRFWNRPLSAALPAPVTVDAKQFTMLVLGADDRPGEPGRSDTMMVGFVDLDQGSVKLLSIPRDSYVQIPGHGWDKINAAYPFGGVALVQQTVEQLVGMKMNYTVAVNMQGFEKIVDAVGGVNIDIPENMDYEDPSDTPPLVIHLQKGLQLLNGVDALHYVRFRHDAQSDWGRMKRQQQFIQALTQAALKPANLTSLPELVKLGSKNVTTNLSLNQLSQLAMLGKDKLGADRISGGTLQGDDIWASDGGYYLGLHFTEMRAKVRELAGITPNDAQTAQDERDAQSYVAGLPKGSSLPGGQTSDVGSGASGSGSASAGSAGNGAIKPASGTGGTQGGGSGSKPDPSPTPAPGSSSSGSGGTSTSPAPGGSGGGGTSPAPGGSGSGSGGTSPAPGAGSGGGSKPPTPPTPPPAPAPTPTPTPTPTPPPAPGKTGSGKSGPGTGSGTGGTSAKPADPGAGNGGTSATTPTPTPVTGSTNSGT